MLLRTLTLVVGLISTASAQSPALLRDINANATGAPASSEPGALRTVGSHVYFSATTFATGRELYRTSGLPGSTQFVADIRPGSGSSSPAGFAPLGTLTLFAADDGSIGAELWRTDGTTVGTTLVRDLAPGEAGSRPSLLTPFAGAVYFATATQELWRSDGTTTGTTRVAAGVPVVSLTVQGGALWFTVSRVNPTQAVELWRSDGTPAGTRLAVALPAEVTTQPMLATLGALFFIGNAGVYRSDGTTAGTTLLVPSNLAHGLTAAAGKLFFAARDQTTSFYELWVSDGTPAGTNFVPVLTTGTAPSLLVADGNRLFFVTAVITTSVSDGTLLGTRRLPGGARFVPLATLADGDRFALLASGNACVFAATSQQTGVELWRSDGTVAGTALVDDLDQQVPTFGSFPREFTQVGGQTYFVAAGSANGGNTDAELWRTDGTPAGTRLIADIEPGPTGSSPGGLASMGGFVYFAATTTASGRELWRSDGTAAGTTLVKDLVPGNSPGNGPLNLQALDERTLLFAGYQPATGYELWVSDGTSAGCRDLRHRLGGPVPSLARAREPGRAGRRLPRADLARPRLHERAGAGVRAMTPCRV